MTHVFERYFTATRGVDYTDKLCEATLKTLIRNAAIVMKEPKNYVARGEIMLAAALANSNHLSMGRIPEYSCHIIEHELSAFYDIPHGAGMSIIYPAWMKYVYKKDLPRFAQFATKVWNIDAEYQDIEFLALEGIKATENFFKWLGLAVTLNKMNIPDDKFEEVAKRCTSEKLLGTTFPLKLKDVINIYKLAK